MVFACACTCQTVISEVQRRTVPSTCNHVQSDKQADGRIDPIVQVSCIYRTYDIHLTTPSLKGAECHLKHRLPTAVPCSYDVSHRCGVVYRGMVLRGAVNHSNVVS